MTWASKSSGPALSSIEEEERKVRWLKKKKKDRKCFDFFFLA
jgi:hypothetical protein